MFYIATIVFLCLSIGPISKNQILFHLEPYPRNVSGLKVVISFFVLPMIMLQGKGPLEAVKESVKLIRATWGMQIAGGIRIGAMIGLLGVLPGIIAVVAGGWLIATDKEAMGIPLATLGVVVVMIAQVLISALRAVFSVALLRYALDGTAIGPFDEAELSSAVRVKAEK